MTDGDIIKLGHGEHDGYVSRAKALAKVKKET